MIGLATELRVAVGMGAIVSLLGVAACSGESDKGSASGAPAPNGDGTDADGGSLPIECPAKGYTKANSDIYVDGLQKVGKDGSFKVDLLSADPTPPSKGQNSWTIRVTDAAGQPVNGATFAWIDSPFMPCHNHGSSVQPVATAYGDGTSGTYAIAPLYFIMPGIWTTTFAITPPNGPDDSAVFQFYVER